MDFPKNFGMKDEEGEYLEVPNHVLRNVLLGVSGLALVMGLFLAIPSRELQTSSISEASAVGTEVVQELQKMNQALIAIQQKDTTIENVHEYLLVKDMEGTKPFTINANTCAHGARVIFRMREAFRGLRNQQSGELTIQGISVAKSKNVYTAQVAVNEAMPATMRNLPIQMLLNNDTVFIDYKISPGKNAERVEYKIECY